MPTNKQIIQGAYQAFAEGDVPKVLALMDDKIEWTEAEGFPLHGTYVGPQAVVDGVFMRLGEIGDEFTVTPTRFVAEDDTVVATGTYSWKPRGSLQRRVAPQFSTNCESHVHSSLLKTVRPTESPLGSVTISDRGAGGRLFPPSGHVGRPAGEATIQSPEPVTGGRLKRRRPDIAPYHRGRARMPVRRSTHSPSPAGNRSLNWE